MGQQPALSSQPSKAWNRPSAVRRQVVVRMMDIWLETASSTSGGSVESKRASRNAHVRAERSGNRSSVSRAAAQASGHCVANQLVIRPPTTDWPGRVSNGPQ
jgi:hypothetical protein